MLGGRIGRVVASRDTASAILLSGCLFLIYAAGACRTIYVGDSGELVAAVYTLGIPHPTSYPLYVLLGKLWTLLLPLGSIAYRMSLFSAVCAALAGGALYRVCRGVGFHPVAALFCALLLAFAPSFWGEANVQRVYALNGLFVVLATGAALLWYRRRTARFLYLTYFLCGLGASNHTVLGVYAIAFSVFVVITEPGIFRRPKEILLAGLCAAAGLLPYMYLPIRSRMDPLLDWGNPESLQGFLDVVLRRNFWVRAWMESPRDLLTIAADFLASVVDQFTWVGVVFAVAGLLAGWRRRWPVLLMLLVTIANVGVMALHGSRTDLFVWHRYYIASYVMMALLAGMSCHALLERLPRIARWLPLALPIFLLATGWKSHDRSRYRIAEEYSKAVLRTLPPGASLIATDDNILFVLIYLTMVEHERPDVNLILQGVGEADLPPLRFNPDREPLFFTHHPNWSLPALDIVPIGLVFQAWRSNRPPPEPNVTLWELPGENDPRVPKDYLTQNLIGYLHYMLGFTFERRDWIRAQREFAAAAAASPHNDVLFYNLGLIYQRNGLFGEAIEAFGRAQAINPRHLASQSRPRAADRIVELQAEVHRIDAIERALLNRDSTLRDTTPGTAAYHLRMAELLAAAGEPTAARGHRLRAETTLRGPGSA